MKMSAHTFDDLSLPELITEALKEYRISPYHISIEITETAIMQDMPPSLDILTLLRIFESLDCERTQGFHLGRPASPEATIDWLKQQ